MEERNPTPTLVPPRYSRSDDRRLVSIVVPTRNRCELLRETLTSFRQQTYSRWEAVVVDDDSSDDTLQMVATISAADPRIRLVCRHRPPQGAQSCRNIGLAAATGEYVIFFDSDDLMAPDCLASRVSFMTAYPELDFVVFQARMFESVPGDLDRLWNCDTGEDPLDRFLRGDVPWWTGSPIWRREALVRVGSWDEDLLCAQDHDYHTRALMSGLHYEWIPEVDVHVRAKQASHESIGSHGQTREHLLSQWTRVRKMTARLRSLGFLVGARRRFVAGSYFWVAASLARQARGGADARKVWAECRAEGLIDVATYALGALYVRGAATRAHLFLLWLIHQFWNEEMFVHDRGLTRNAPMALQYSPEAALEFARRNRLARQHRVVRDGLIRWTAQRAFTRNRRVGVGEHSRLRPELARSGAEEPS